MILDKHQLQNIALELNQVMGLEPEIDIYMDICNLQSAICKAASLIQPYDKLSIATVDHIHQIVRLSINKYSPDFTCIDKSKIQVIGSMYELHKAAVLRQKRREARSKKYKKTRARNIKLRNEAEKLSSRHYINRIHELVQEQVYSKQEIFSIIIFEFPKEKHNSILLHIDRIMEVK